MDNTEHIPWADKKVVYFSRFYNNPNGHGGDKRTAQICELLSQMEYEFVSMYSMPLPYSNKQRQILNKPSGLIQAKLAFLYKQHVTCWKYQHWSERIRDYIFDFHALAKVFINNLKNTTPDLLVVDDPVFLAPIVSYAKVRNIPLISVCHNIETLSREQVESSSQLEMFKYELDLISKCDLVITISKEETFLLTNFGMNAVYLPYFPTIQTATRFEKISSERHEKIKSNYLLFGTVYNLPTLDGMKKVINAIILDNILQNDHLIIAGYGTNNLSIELHDSRIELRGEVSDAELDEMLTTVKGCIVYQENGSGALTKIPELLCAGVPVVINSHAARSHHNLPGIFEFATFEQLGQKLEAAAQIDRFPQVLSPPDTTQLKKRILELAA